jgi:hypothetical protein
MNFVHVSLVVDGAHVQRSSADFITVRVGLQRQQHQQQSLVTAIVVWRRSSEPSSPSKHGSPCRTAGRHRHNVQYAVADESTTVMGLFTL